MLWVVLAIYLTVGCIVAKIAYNLEFNDRVKNELTRVHKSLSEARRMEIAVGRVTEDPPYGIATMFMFLWPALIVLALIILPVMGVSKLFHEIAAPASVRQAKQLKAEEAREKRIADAMQFLKNEGVKIE